MKVCRYSSVGRASPLQGEGPQFESGWRHHLFALSILFLGFLACSDSKIEQQDGKAVETQVPNILKTPQPSGIDEGHQYQIKSDQLEVQMESNNTRQQVPCRGKECRCIEEGPADMTAAQKRFLCQKNPNAFGDRERHNQRAEKDSQSRGLGGDSALEKTTITTKTVTESAPKAQNEKSVEQRQVKEDVLTRQEDLNYSPPPKIECWDGCVGGFSMCHAKCGPGVRCWANCMNTHAFCAKKCGPGPICHLKCKAAGDQCFARCGEKVWSKESDLSQN